MPISLPSKKIAIVDAPEVESFDVKFVYNFFTPDERVNETGIVEADTIRKRPTESFDTEFIDSVNFRRFVPRFNRITWQPVVLDSLFNQKVRVSIADNLDKIYNETSFSTDEFTLIRFQDDDADSKFSYFVRRIMDEARKGEEPDEDESIMDITKFLNDVTSKNVKSNFISDSISKLSDQGQRFVDLDGNEIIQESVLSEISNVGVRSQLNNKLITKLLKTTNQNTINVFNDEVSELLNQAKQIEQKAISEKPSTVMEGRDYDFEITQYVDAEAIDTNGFDSVAQVVGYIINKTEIGDNGEEIEHPPIVVESAFANSAADLKIKYGARYEYSIQTVVLFKVQAEDADENEVIALSFLISSQPTTVRAVDCDEFVPPPPPADFNIVWDYYANKPRLMWNFPVNKQRDIKYFQVFRRDSIEDPFELIKMYDFDDSEVLSEFNEVPQDFLIERVTSPVTTFTDLDFELDSAYIYAVCCIDAHGFTSNYSIQYDIQFNRFTNKLEKDITSRSGAPKAYPNLFLETDTFVDSIRDSGHKKLRVIFNPEYLKVVDSNNNDLRVLKAEEGDKYRLQLINVDLQEQQVFDINLLDIRKTNEKTNDNSDE